MTDKPKCVLLVAAVENINVLSLEEPNEKKPAPLNSCMSNSSPHKSRVSHIQSRLFSEHFHVEVKLCEIFLDMSFCQQTTLRMKMKGNRIRKTAGLSHFIELRHQKQKCIRLKYYRSLHLKTVDDVLKQIQFIT